MKTAILYMMSTALTSSSRYSILHWNPETHLASPPGTLRPSDKRTSYPKTVEKNLAFSLHLGAIATCAEQLVAASMKKRKAPVNAGIKESHILEARNTSDRL